MVIRKYINTKSKPTAIGKGGRLHSKVLPCMINKYTMSLSYAVTRRRAITEEVGYFVDLGLGRGVDATEEKPWLNRSTFQVRRVTESNILGTEEGDLIRGFVNEVESTQLLQANLRASVTASELVNIGVDSELSRKVSESQKSVGEKIITRTISFRTDFENVDEGKREQKIGEGENGVCEQTFESLLKGWIDKRHTKNEEYSNSHIMYRWKTKNKETSPLTEEKIKVYCSEFVEKYCITHYVHSLELGASYYFTLSEKEFETKVKSKISASGRGAGAAITSEGGLRRKKLQEEATVIGRMTPLRKSPNDGPKSHTQDWTVCRGTTDEAVVGVKLQPITSLIRKSVVLRGILQQAVQKYIDDHQNVKCKLVSMPTYT